MFYDQNKQSNAIYLYSIIMTNDYIFNITQLCNLLRVVCSLVVSCCLLHERTTPNIHSSLQVHDCMHIKSIANNYCFEKIN